MGALKIRLLFDLSGARDANGTSPGRKSYFFELSFRRISTKCGGGAQGHFLFSHPNGDFLLAGGTGDWEGGSLSGRFFPGRRI